MAKVISEYVHEQADTPQMIEIKHTSTKTDVDGNEVTVVEWTEHKELSVAIGDCETRKTQLEADLALCEAELADMIAIRDAA